MTPQHQAALAALVGRQLTQAEIEKITPLVSVRRDDLIAAELSIGRMRLAPTEVGNGTILEVLGLAAGNALMDVINSEPDFRHVRPLVEQGRLRLDSVLVRSTLQSMVGTVLSQPQADALLARAEQPDPIPTSAVSDALNGA